MAEVLKLGYSGGGIRSQAPPELADAITPWAHSDGQHHNCPWLRMSKYFLEWPFLFLFKVGMRNQIEESVMWSLYWGLNDKQNIFAPSVGKENCPWPDLANVNAASHLLTARR